MTDPLAVLACQVPMAGSRGVLGVTGPPSPPPPPHHTHTHSTAIYKCRSIRISFRLEGLRSMKMAIPFFLGGGEGGREGVSEEAENLGEAPPLINCQLPRTVKNIYMQFSYSVTPPPRVSGSAPGACIMLVTYNYYLQPPS